MSDENEKIVFNVGAGVTGGSVAFLGLAGRQSRNVLRTCDEVWTLNDWYRVYDGVSPDRVYQIHGNFQGGNLPGRYDNWRAEYEESGAGIVSMCSLGFRRELLFDKERALKEFGKEFFVSSLSYMFADAIWSGVAEIYLEGVDLIAGEFLRQVPGTLRNIEAARAAGIIVHAKNETEWRYKLATIPWNKIQDFDKPYWQDAAPALDVLRVSAADKTICTTAPRAVTDELEYKE